MLKTSDQFKKYFDSIIRQRGNDYYKVGRTELSRKTDSVFYFHVFGSTRYEVEIAPEEDHSKSYINCTCPYFTSFSACKHIWACLLKLDDLNQISPEINSKPLWQKKLIQVKNEISKPVEAELFLNDNKPNQRSALFVINLQKSKIKNKIVIDFFCQEYLKSGKLGAVKQISVSKDQILYYEDIIDQEVLWLILGKSQLRDKYSYWKRENDFNSAEVAIEFTKEILEKISQNNKLFLRDERSSHMEELIKISFDSNKWNLELLLSEKQDKYNLQGNLNCDGVQKTKFNYLFDRFVMFENKIAQIENKDTKAWLNFINSKNEFIIPKNEIYSFLDLYFQYESAPPLQLPKELKFDEVKVKPEVILNFKGHRDSTFIKTHLEFKYKDKIISLDNPKQSFFDSINKVMILRDIEFEKLSINEFLLFEPLKKAESYLFSNKQFMSVVEKALDLKWEVYSNQMKVHQGGNFNFELRSSGIDWFDLSVDFNFQNGQSLKYPDIIQNLRSSDRMILLGDGSYGMLPKEWLEKFAPLAHIGQLKDGQFRISNLQAMFVNSFLDINNKFKDDKRIKTFNNIITALQNPKSVKAPSTFKGVLRPYQKEGLSWLQTLYNENIGGILADEMGLGKTIQIIALLCSNYKKNSSLKTIIVAPKSLIFNWKNEFNKFAPHLSVFNYTGINRKENLNNFEKHQVFLTTYQTLRNDIESFKDIDFDCFILDEAHYIKNADSQSYMASRLIKAKSKLALTGTPVENSLLDLFSILSIVNPGLISDENAQSWNQTSDATVLKNLSLGLKPFLLRRTKDQVLKDLPTKVEQTLFCELSDIELKKYNELKAYYWSRLNDKFDKKGFSNSKIEILEALLRLRQASCHQGLIDKNKVNLSSSKLDLLFQQIETVISEKHKILIFSQFTSLLGILKFHLDQKNIRYEYLDGKTTKREEVVNNFQNNPDIPIFLISLKAGGIGLNLTAAEYVYILDPWWNPAAESQAIDRTHRIGQTKKVFSYKIIAKNTIEEKILDLQNKKKKLAQAIISNDNSLFKSLKLSDLQVLFK